MATKYESERAKFLKKWNGKHLDDWGSVVSHEYKLFQIDMIKLWKVMARVIGCEVVKPSMGHYFTSCFIKHNDEYVYIYCGQGFDRTHIDLNTKDIYKQIYIRTAMSSSDYQGGVNQFVTLDELGINVVKLFSQMC